MTPQEQQMLQSLTDRVNQTVLTDKDPDAERYLQDTLGRNPDALYILAQTTLVQQYALTQAQKQLAELKQQQQQAPPPPPPQKHTSFLGSLLGHDDPAPPPPAYQPVQNYAPPQPQYAQPQYGAPQYGQPQYAQGYPQPQSGGFLHSALQTATGVAAGALAFEGIESLMHGFGGGHSGYGQGFGGFDGGMGNSGRPEEIINNNYYGDSQREHSQQGLSPDIDDRRDNNSGDFSSRLQQADTSTPYDPLGNDPLNPDDSDTDTSSLADTSSTDDSSSYDPTNDFGSSDNS